MLISLEFNLHFYFMLVNCHVHLTVRKRDHVIVLSVVGIDLRRELHFFLLLVYLFDLRLVELCYTCYCSGLQIFLISVTNHYCFITFFISGFTSHL